MSGISSELADRIVAAHADRYPEATPEAVLLKLGEELGELMRAVNTGRGSVAEEIADVLGVLLVFAGRFLPELELEEITAAKHRRVVERWASGRRDPNEEDETSEFWRAVAARAVGRQQTVEVVIDVDPSIAEKGLSELAAAMRGWGNEARRFA